MSTPDVFVQHRSRLVRTAYRLLGSVSDAEDVVQESWLRWSAADRSDVRDPLAFLVRTTTRLALDRLRRIDARREVYTGQWLPEPIPTEPAEDAAVRSEELSMALQRILETLSPLERATYVLREAFDLSYAEIGEIIGRSEGATRQLAHRARQHIDARRPRYETDPALRQEVAERFRQAVVSGDLEALLVLLAPGVTLIADGGGKVRAPLLPVHGAEKVSRFLLTVAQRELPATAVEPVAINDGLGLLVSSSAGPQAVLEFDIGDGRIETIYLVGNPDKLVAMSRADGGAASSG